MLALWVEQLLGFASGALTVIRETERYPDLMFWTRREGAALMGGDLAMAQALAPELWSQTPLERLGFACEPLARPGRNEPCWCDSGRKTKHCCGAVQLPGALPEHLMWMLSLREWKGNTLKAALNSGLAPAQALLEAGLIAAETGQRGRAQQILESLFAIGDWARLPEQSEPAFEILIDLYQERGFHRKREALLSEVLSRGPLFLRGVALERLCLLHLDNDDMDSARDAFVRAQQTLPDSPTLAYLEAMLLLHEGNEQAAIERSRFWYRRLARQGELDEGQLQFLADLAEDPAATLAEQLLNAEEELAEPLVALQELFEYLPEPPDLSLEHSADGEVIYRASERETALYEAFQAVFAAQLEEDGMMSFDRDPWLMAGDWLPALCANPEWFDAPRVVQSLAMALTGRFGSLPWMTPGLLEPLSQRLESWLGQVQAAGQTVGQAQEQTPSRLRMDWDQGDNAVLLGTGLTLVVGMERGAQLRSRRLAESLMSLDDQDTLGLRELVLDQLLREGRDQEALALSERAIASIDSSDSKDATTLGLLLGRALALYRLGRKTEASEALESVRRHNPHALPALCAEASPPINDADAAPGTRAEAQQYRALMRDQWRATPSALEWLAGHASGK